MAERITFDINGGDNIQVWEQDGHDGAVSLYTMIDNWERNNEIKIPAGDMVMLGNLYREIKEQDIKNPFLNYYGKNKLTTDAYLSATLRKQIPLKVIKDNKAVTCPICHTAVGYISEMAIIGDAYYCQFKYCRKCGQALDWSDCNGES